MIKNILITSAGRRVSLVKNFKQTLAKYNKTGKVYTTDMNPDLSSACLVSDGFFKVPRVSDKTYIDILKDICKKNNISIIVPTIDTELEILANVKNDFLKENISISISSEWICSVFSLKNSTEKFFLENDFKTPKNIDNLSTCKYPIFAKLNNSSCSIGAKKVYSQEEAKELSKDKNYIFQEFIQGEEFTVDVFMDRDSQVISVVPRKRLEVRAGEISKGLTCKDEGIIKSIKSLCKKLNGGYGCLTIQLFKTNDSIIFIEINPRFGGGYPLSCESGADFAQFLIEDFLGKKLSFTQDWKDKTLMLRYDGEVIKHDYSI